VILVVAQRIVKRSGVESTVIPCYVEIAAIDQRRLGVFIICVKTAAKGNATYFVSDTLVDAELETAMHLKL